MEVFAGFSENADWNVGRLLDAIEGMGDLDNTLIFYIWGDNGASMEGTDTGSFNEMTFLNGLVLDADKQLDANRAVRRDRGVRRRSHRAALRRRLGARREHSVPVRQADLESPWRYPQPDGGRVAEPDQVRRRRAQPVHALHRHRSDGARGGRYCWSPSSVDGIEQEPMDGTSFVYTADDPRAQERHTVQYFEFAGNRGDLQGRLVGGIAAGPSPVGLLAGDAQALRTRVRLGSRPGRAVGALLPARRLLPGPQHRRRAPRQGRGSSRSCSGPRPSATACCR